MDIGLARLTWLLVGIGIALRVWQFAGGASLWLDEVALARNIAGRGYTGLLQPLDFGQIAPPGFLFLQRLLWTAFRADWALRVVPFCAAIATLLLMRKLALRILDGIAVPLLVGVFALGVPYIMYGAQVKQYSTDLAIATGLLLLAVRLVDAPDGRTSSFAFAGLAGALAPWFSSPSVLVLTGLGTALGVVALKWSIANRRRLIWFVLIPWAIMALAASLAAARAVRPETMAYMHVFWRPGFMPLPPWPAGNLTWLWHTFVGVFGAPRIPSFAFEGLGFRLAGFYTILTLLGFVMLWRTRRAIALLLAGPIAVTVGAAAMRMYPFSGRLVLFLAPAFLLLAAFGMGEIAAWLGSVARPARWAFVLLLSFIPVERILKLHPVYRIQETRAMLDSMAVQRRPGDAVFVWYQVAPNVEWYGARYGLTADNTVVGGCWLAQPRRFLEDIDRLRGRPRAWIVVAGAGSDEVTMVRDYADSIGTRLATIRPPATVGFFPLRLITWLYDFSDPVRLARATATDTSIHAPVSPQWLIAGCAAGPTSPARPR